MTELIKMIAQVNSSWSIAAFAIAAILMLFNVVARQGSARGKSAASKRVPARAGGGEDEDEDDEVPPPRAPAPQRSPDAVRSLIWGMAVVICFLGSLPILANAYLETQRMKLLAVYRLRVLVVDPQGVPLTGAVLRTTASNETTTTSQGIGQVTVAAATMPADGKITVYADLEAAFLHGKGDIQLAKEPNPSLRLELQSSGAAMVTGFVQDDASRAIPGAAVTVLGGESGTTKADGTFTLKTNAAPGQVVRIHAEKVGYAAVNQDHPAGREPATIVLSSERRGRKRAQ